MAYINGKKKSEAVGKTIAEYLKEAGYKESQVAVERNCAIVSKSVYAETKIEEEDTIEVLSFVGGG